MVEELAKSPVVGKKRSLILDDVHSLNHGWVVVCLNQENKGKFISILYS